jgi:molecular chaperone GrpE (heat shock protein)
LAAVLQLEHLQTENQALRARLEALELLIQQLQAELDNLKRRLALEEQMKPLV